MYPSVGATITKYYRMGGSNNRNLLLTVLEAGKSEIKVPDNLISGESHPSGL